MDRAADLRVLYDSLWPKFHEAEGSAAGNLAAQIRLVGAELETLESTGEVSLVDELAVKRAETGAGRPPSRRKSG